ncbi:preprotein translocase subunit SecE [uncultured Acetobacteroides sp.]|jgi:preprotein translocase subunit SecE|uniref:preprotein translocase subunit SecE n=1 Tax=uncultured Acetobacteroides sp. TaxID=1760811 RepID=UPI0029F48ACB|nr:preprotein translocase subunit SecE [uncultured Acetobacteroides sp.]
MRIKEYFKESYNELKNKVSWPSWSTLQNSAIVVMIASLLFAIVVFAMDITFRNLMELIYSML